MKSDTHAGNFNHLKISSTIADGNGLGDRDTPRLGSAQQGGAFTRGINDLTDKTTGKFTVNNLQLITM